MLITVQLQKRNARAKAMWAMTIRGSASHSYSSWPYFKQDDEEDFVKSDPLLSQTTEQKTIHIL